MILVYSGINCSIVEYRVLTASRLDDISVSSHPR